MIGLDTNVLVRLLTRDEPAQTARAEALLRQARDTGQILRIDAVVLVETVWVLQRAYRTARTEIAAVLAALLDNAAFDIADRSAVETASRLFAEGRADFADCLIAARNEEAGCAFTATFDRGALEVPGMKSP